jgi:Spy/CpxP family protein refolding chaperone
MTDLNTPNPTGNGSGPTSTDQRPRSHRRGGRKALIIVALIGSFFAGGVLFSHMHAVGEDMHMPPWMQHGAWMGGPGPHRPDGPPGPMTPERHVAHGRMMLDQALTSVEATADQKAKILAIYDKAANDLREAPLITFQTQLQIATLLTAPTIDHNKIEQLRAARITDIDSASKIIVKAVTEAADVLNQDQRTRLVMMMEHMRHGPPPPPAPHEPPMPPSAAPPPPPPPPHG